MTRNLFHSSVLRDWMCSWLLSHGTVYSALNTTPNPKRIARSALPSPVRPHCSWHPLVSPRTQYNQPKHPWLPPNVCRRHPGTHNWSRNSSCTAFKKTTTKLSQPCVRYRNRSRCWPLANKCSTCQTARVWVRSDMIRVSNPGWTVTPSPTSFCSPTAAAGRATGCGASFSHTTPTGVNRCAERGGVRADSYGLSHKSTTAAVINQLPVS